MKTSKLVYGSALVLAGLVFVGCKDEEGKEAGDKGGMMARVQAVEVSEVELKNLEDVVVLPGNLLPTESAEMKPEIAGVIRAIGFEEGKGVKRGDMLIEIDKRELEASLAQAKAQLELAQRNLARARALVDSNAIARAELDSAVAEERRLLAEAQLLEVKIDKSTMRAPFDGVAGARNLSVGDFVTSATPVTRIEDISQLKIQVEVPEAYLGRVGEGTALEVGVAGLGGKLKGKVYFVSPRVNETTRAAEVKGVLANPGDSARPGMFASVRVVLQRKTGVMCVPETALMAGERGTVVVVARPVDGKNVLEFVPVRVGLREPGMAEVEPLKAGALKAGDKVVSAGAGSLILIPGMDVEVRESRRAGKAPVRTDRTIPTSGSAGKSGKDS